jgi:hypothetical protein
MHMMITSRIGMIDMPMTILQTVHGDTLAMRKFLEDRGGDEDRIEAYASYEEYGPESTTMRFAEYTFASIRLKHTSI